MEARIVGLVLGVQLHRATFKILNFALQFLVVARGGAEPVEAANDIAESPFGHRLPLLTLALTLALAGCRFGGLPESAEDVTLTNAITWSRVGAATTAADRAALRSAALLPSTLLALTLALALALLTLTLALALARLLPLARLLSLALLTLALSTLTRLLSLLAITRTLLPLLPALLALALLLTLALLHPLQLLPQTLRLLQSALHGLLLRIVPARAILTRASRRSLRLPQIVLHLIQRLRHRSFPHWHIRPKPALQQTRVRLHARRNLGLLRLP